MDKNVRQLDLAAFEEYRKAQAAKEKLARGETLNEPLSKRTVETPVSRVTGEINKEAMRETMTQFEREAAEKVDKRAVILDMSAARVMSPREIAAAKQMAAEQSAQLRSNEMDMTPEHPHDPSKDVKFFDVDEVNREFERMQSEVAAKDKPKQVLQRNSEASNTESKKKPEGFFAKIKNLFN